MLVSTSLSKARSQGGLKEAAHRDLVERSSCQPVSPQQIVDRSSVVLVMSLCRVILPMYSELSVLSSIRVGFQGTACV